MLVGTGIFSFGYMTGVTARRGKNRTVKEVKPICGCNHSLSYHDPDTGRCHGWHKMTGYHPNQCACRHYDGPQPLPEIYAPDIIE